MLRILVLLFVISVSTGLSAARLQGHVIRVLDGDTLDVLQDNQPVRVRLANIDAPEKKQPFGRWSTNALKTLIAEKSVTVVYTQKDRYGRVLGQVFTTDISVNREMVRQGAAWVYDRYNTDDALPAIQQDARSQKRGLWSDRHPVPPWEWRHRR